MKLTDLKPNDGAIRVRSRVGRGPGSGNGTTGGRGYNGQRARSGGGVRPGFEGGQMPLTRSLPKRGFRNIFRREYQPVNLAQIDKKASGQMTVDPSALKDMGLVSDLKRRIKILGDGNLSMPVTIRAHAFSASALEKIKAANGKAEVLGVGSGKDSS